MNADDYTEKASNLIRSGEWDNAIMNLKFAEKIDPNNPAIHLFFFNAYGATRNKDLARKHFLIFQELEPTEAKNILDDMPDDIKEALGL